MLDLCNNCHIFTLQEVIDNYYLRSVEHAVIKDYSEDETEESNVNKLMTNLNFMTDVFPVLLLNHA